MKRLLLAFPDQPEVLKRLGIMYQTQLKFPESIQTFQKLLRIDPRYSEVNFYRGLSFLGLNDYDKALECFDQELKFNPHSY
jgi:tetratricopeptide (TPR) repeat protein